MSASFNNTPTVSMPDPAGEGDQHWRPPSIRLPVPYSHINIKNCDPDSTNRKGEPDYCSSKRIVYHGYDKQRSCQVVMIFHRVSLNVTQQKDQAQDRYTLDLRDEWWPIVEIIYLDSVLHLDPDDPGNDDKKGYKVNDFLGLGGFGEVWSAEDLRAPEEDPSRRQVALKFFTTTEKENKDLDSEEAEKALQLRKESVLRGMEDFTIRIREKSIAILNNRGKTKHPGWPRRAIVMERASASLHDVLNTGNSLPPEIVTRITQRLINALSNLHSLKRVHCDIKPQNILFLLPDRQLWSGIISDLQQAKIVLGDLDNITIEGVVPDKPLAQDSGKHRAPELMLKNSDGSPSENRDRDAVAKSEEDVYALGRVFERLAQIVEGGGTWLADVAKRMLDNNPANRPHLNRRLMMDVSPVWKSVSNVLREDAGWLINKTEYEKLIGRTWVRDEFEQFCDQQRIDGRGGIFLLTAEAGMGKTSILTHWNNVDRLGCRSTGRSGVDDPKALGLHPGFYFRFETGNVSQSQMIRAIVRQLNGPPYNVSLPEGKLDADVDARELRDMLRQAVTTLPNDRVLVLIFDGMDESSNPKDAVQFLWNLCQSESGQDLPDRVFLLVASRPVDVSGKPFINRLKQLGDFVFEFELKQKNEWNLKDAKDFWQQECRRLLKEDQISTALAATDKAVENASGIFMILRSVIDEIKEGNLTLDEYLSQEPCQKVSSWHEKQWERITKPYEDRPEIEGNLEQLARILAVIREPVPTELLADWMDMSSIAKLKPFLKRLSWLTIQEPCGTTDLWFRRHKSVLDFLTTTGPAKDSIAEVHSKIGHCVINVAQKKGDTQQPNWEMVEFDYGIRHVVSHLLEASGPEPKGRENYRHALRLLTDQLYLDVRLNLRSPE